VARTELIDFESERPDEPEYYGEYLVHIGGCAFCHGDDLRGGQGLEPGAPPGTNLRLGGPLDDYTLEDFDRVMRTGMMLDGEVVDPIYMPWVGYNNMTDDDIEAIWEYLRSE
jgi:mono/diheme cytochrome c family protein